MSSNFHAGDAWRVARQARCLLAAALLAPGSFGAAAAHAWTLEALLRLPLERLLALPICTPGTGQPTGGAQRPPTDVRDPGVHRES